MRQRSDDRSPRNVSALWGLTGPALGPSHGTRAWGFFFSLGDLGFVEFFLLLGFQTCTHKKWRCTGGRSIQDLVYL